MNEQVRYYENKLAFEIDSWDLDVIMKADENIIVVDARSTDAYRKEHIPGSLSLPHLKMNEETTKMLDRKALIVVYCDGIGCNASTKGALKLSRLGFSVKELLGGLDWWKRDGYTTSGIESKEDSSSGSCGCG